MVTTGICSTLRMVYSRILYILTWIWKYCSLFMATKMMQLVLLSSIGNLVSIISLDSVRLLNVFALMVNIYCASHATINSMYETKFCAANAPRWNTENSRLNDYSDTGYFVGRQTRVNLECHSWTWNKTSLWLSTAELLSLSLQQHYQSNMRSRFILLRLTRSKWSLCLIPRNSILHNTTVVWLLKLSGQANWWSIIDWLAALFSGYNDTFGHTVSYFGHTGTPTLKNSSAPTYILRMMAPAPLVPSK